MPETAKAYMLPPSSDGVWHISALGMGRMPEAMWEGQLDLYGVPQGWAALMTVVDKKEVVVKLALRERSGTRFVDTPLTVAKRVNGDTGAQLMTVSVELLYGKDINQPFAKTLMAGDDPMVVWYPDKEIITFGAGDSSETLAAITETAAGYVAGVPVYKSYGSFAVAAVDGICKNYRPRAYEPY